MPESLKQQTKKGILWSVVDRFSTQTVFFIIMLFMARLLSPSDYGVLGMLSIFLAVAQSLIDCGFCQALIRKQNRTDVDNSTVFYFNIVVSILLYGVLYVAAPWIAKFYNVPILTSVLRVMGATLVLNSFTLVQRANIMARVDFKTIARASFSGSVLSGLVGLVLAYNGFGVWTLVIQQIIQVVVHISILWSYSPWRPIWAFSWNSFRQMFGFGSKLMFSSLISVIYDNTYELVIGKVFSATSLGYYSRATHFAQFPSSNITDVVSRVTYPVLCSIQNEDDRLRIAYRRLIRMFAYVVFPLMLGLAAISHPFIQVFLGSKWGYCAVLLQIRCFALMWHPIQQLNLNLLVIKGHSDLYLRLEIVKKIVGVVILCITVPYGLEFICYGDIVNSIFVWVINTCYTGKLIHIGLFRQMRDVFPAFILSMSMFVLLLLVERYLDGYWLQLIIGIPLAITYYYVASKVFHFSELGEVSNLFLRGSYHSN
jgi:O-antigen/teichoic acid export membrane protein